MFQQFHDTSEGDQGARRLAELRAVMGERSLDAFLVPRADAHQGEYVADCDARLAWLTGFTGSAGFCAVLKDKAGVFVDGRYRVQVKEQTDLNVYTPVEFPEVKLADWLSEHLSKGAKVGFDPWLHAATEVEQLEKTFSKQEITLAPSGNLVDVIWHDRPAAPVGKAFEHPIEFAGVASLDKRNSIATFLQSSGQRAAVITLPDSICWLLNIRGSDIPRVPILQAFAIIGDDAKVAVFTDPDKLSDISLGEGITVQPQQEFNEHLARLSGPVLVDKATAPYAIKQALDDNSVEIAWGDDPCRLPKARKNETELEGARAAHIRDAVAMVKFLCWIDEAAPTGRLDEIRVAERLEEFRRESNLLVDISFETISATGPNAALPHYRVNTTSNRPVVPGEILLVDSGGQYADGTTDITRTMATGPADVAQKEAFTRVLQGMIAISRLRFPRGLAGRDLDALARYPLWLAGQDYDHGTGHGIGSYLSVHEGPQSLSRRSHVPLEEGMMLSNEPGYYAEGHFGIRTENLIIVKKADQSGDMRDQLDFETITFVPIDKRLIVKDMLSLEERSWLNDYHKETWEKVSPLLDGSALEWLRHATAPL